ncbi:predicted protein [Sclerotinia sclerotiorum 1980 UF-70]|uniref:Uncharacterized protein n=1 Tax=Sclerotinia sclerotiorum (strain ATCC 18683 / 1980 / Ss-1) TaxID=665079 RepID=A7E4F2_SCLS1|nr:predicted protein [Sclerotinia sclerotiorum 1980 UF-70]EDN90774.1 predicted protein [Sclerotinia sclerotiorum 1980 UF-70]
MYHGDGSSISDNKSIALQLSNINEQDQGMAKNAKSDQHLNVFCRPSPTQALPAIDHSYNQRTWNRSFPYSHCAVRNKQSACHYGTESAKKQQLLGDKTNTSSDDGELFEAVVESRIHGSGQPAPLVLQSLTVATTQRLASSIRSGAMRFLFLYIDVTIDNN